MFERILKQKIIDAFTKFPVVALCGPRQSGKTTLVKQTFPDLEYINLEDPSLRALIKHDPKSFLDSHKNSIIIDEIQNLPELFSYLQVYVDMRDKPGQYIITGSQQFLLNEKISQSLAGRVAILNLLPLSYLEIASHVSNLSLNELIFKGFYPRLYQYNIDPEEFYGNYVQTYLERDLRQIQNVTDLSLFQKFMKLCAGRVGQMLNLSSIAMECGVSHVTMRKWLSALEASYVIYLLRPYHANFNKRITKSPKIYFYDPGLASYLLEIKSASQFSTHFAKGSLFENYILSEILKHYFNHGKRPDLYYLRNKTGQEVDFVYQKDNKLFLMEIKLSNTIHHSFFSNLQYWKDLIKNSCGYLVFGGTSTDLRVYKDCEILSWKELYRAL